MQRREAFKTGFSLLALVAGGVAVGTQYASATQLPRLRPPGALSEDAFLTKCIRCGLCVSACPFDTLRLAQFRDNGVGIGTPFFEPRKIPCYMCTDIPCTEACPTDALDKKALSEQGSYDINKARMGIAVVDELNCVAYLGVQCDACYRACPLIDKAIVIDARHNDRTGKHAMLLPKVDPAYCTGCGKCEHACITKKAAITVVPRELIVGELNDNYVVGWQEGGDAKLKDADTNIKMDLKKSIKALDKGVEL